MENTEYGLEVVNVRLVREKILYSDRVIDSPGAAVDVMKEELSCYDREVFCILNLKTDGSVINMNIVSQGTLNASMVDPREVFKASILSNAAAMILLHNHPSGSRKPTKEDYDITKRLCDCGALMGIRIVDHVIVPAGNREPYSLSAHDELGKSYYEVMNTKNGYER